VGLAPAIELTEKLALLVGIGLWEGFQVPVCNCSTSRAVLGATTMYFRGETVQ
jgi:hypothetical protein